MLVSPDAFRYWFLGLYGLGVAAFIVTMVHLLSHRGSIEKRSGPMPSPGILIPIGVPLLILLSRVGELRTGSPAVRYVGFALSLYYLVLLPWTLMALGRFALPGMGVYRDHRLITSGPFALVRNPLYSATVALWLGAGLGTVNWLLLALWPFFAAIMIRFPMRLEERLLGEKFGPEYEAYAKRTARLVPGIW